MTIFNHPFTSYEIIGISIVTILIILMLDQLILLLKKPLAPLFRVLSFIRKVKREITFIISIVALASYFKYLY